MSQTTSNGLKTHQKWSKRTHPARMWSCVAQQWFWAPRAQRLQWLPPASPAALGPTLGPCLGPHSLSQTANQPARQHGGMARKSNYLLPKTASHTVKMALGVITEGIYKRGKALPWRNVVGNGGKIEFLRDIFEENFWGKIFSQIFLKFPESSSACKTTSFEVLYAMSDWFFENLRSPFL